MVKKMDVATPKITTYLGYAMSLSIVLQSKKGWEWFIQSFTNIVVNYTNDFDNIIMDFYNLTDVYFNAQEMYQCSNIHCPPLTTYSIPRQLINSNQIVSFIKSQIDNDFYISIFINRKYIKLFGYEMIHDVFIYGYDDTSNQFIIGEYANMQKYSEKYCSYEELENAYKYMDTKLTDNHDFYECITNVDKINLMKLNDKYFGKFNLRNLIKSYESYLYPNLRVNNFDMHIQHEKDSTILKMCTGVEIYAVLKCYIKNRLLCKKEIDYKQINLFYEHKKMYFIRGKYLEENKIAINNFLDDTDSLLKKSEIFRNVVIKYNIELINGISEDKVNNYLIYLDNLISEISILESSYLSKIIKYYFQLVCES